MYVELGRRYPTARAAVEPLEAAAAAAAGHAHSHPVGGVAVLPMPPMQRQGTPPVNAMLPAGPQVPVVTVAVAAVAVVLGDIGHGDILNVLASDLGDRSCGEQLQMFFFIFLF